MVWGYILTGLGGIFLGFIFSGLFSKSPSEKQKDDEEQIEYLRKLAEKKGKQNGRDDSQRC